MNISNEEFKQFVESITLNPTGTSLYFNNYSKLKLFYNAIKSNCINIVNFLINNYKDSVLNGDLIMNPLYMAASQGNNAVIEILVNADVNIDRQINSGRTALYVACLLGYYDCVKTLLDAGANYNIIANNGRNCFFAASVNGHINVMKLLIERGVDTDMTYEYAIRNNNFNVIKTLILYANINPYEIYVKNLNANEKIKNLLLEYKVAARYISNWGFEQLYKPDGIMVKNQKKKYKKCLIELMKNEKI